ncbi:hypothetical protein BCR42DRAFT_419261 [Absidia repens]|uniref:Uncharacterized protein n=1 Tax=Absidia repens TaxID=90262 RepID=A0A1X2IB65_9FUNG|nr:hypothetical protein BCR42DRAFT_419261 [Absidia repens]
MHRFSQQACQLTRPVNTLSRRYTSQTSKNAGEVYPAESFSTSAWKKTAIVFAIGSVWYNVDQSIANAGNKNVFTKWVEYCMTPSDENNKINESFYSNSQSLTDYRLIYQ